VQPDPPVPWAAVIAPWNGDGEWLRCQLHSHTTNSDGEATPDGLVEHYDRAGFDVLAITDHWHITTAAHDELLLIPSSELSAKLEGRGDFDADVLAYGIDVLPEPREEFPSIAAAAEWIVDQGGVAYLAHPYWSGLRAEDYLAAPALSGIEVMNAGSELLQGNGLSAVHWDDILHLGGRCLAIATDDSHYPGQDSRLAWTMVAAPERSRGAVLAALRAGDFYATSGAAILGIEVDAGGIEVRCGPARSVTVRSGPWDGCRVDAGPFAMNWRGRVLDRRHDGAITQARFEPPEYWKWGRVEVVSVEGATAWSNPFVVA
jgi:hypothetical protein